MRVLLTMLICTIFAFQSMALNTLAYQNPDFVKLSNYLSRSPSWDDVFKTVALNKLDSKMYDDLVMLARQEGIEIKKPIPNVTLSGNKIVIEGISAPIIISNKEKLELTYKNEIIPLKDSKNLFQTINDMKFFFNKKGVSYFFHSNPVFSIVELMFESKKGYALGAIGVGLILGTLIVGGYILFDYSSKSNTSDWKNEWPFQKSNWDKDIEIKCSGDVTELKQGTETFSFSYDSFASHKITPDQFTEPYPAYKVNYYNTNTRQSGQFLYKLSQSQSEKSHISNYEGYFSEEENLPNSPKTKTLIQLVDAALQNGTSFVCKDGQLNSSRGIPKLVGMINEKWKNREKSSVESLKVLDSQNAPVNK